MKTEILTSQSPSRERLYSASQLLSSLYIATLIVSVNGQTKGFSWAIRLRSLYLSHYRHHIEKSLDDSHGVFLVAFLLVWSLTLVALLSQRALATFPKGKKVLLPFIGIVSISGYPIAVLYVANGGLLFLQLEAVVGVIFALLYLYRGWPTALSLSIILLTLHFALWSWGFQYSTWPGWILFWPGWSWVWRSGKWSSLVYPLIGFSSSMTWILSVKRLPHFSKHG